LLDLFDGQRPGGSPLFAADEPNEQQHFNHIENRYRAKEDPPQPIPPIVVSLDNECAAVGLGLMTRQLGHVVVRRPA
jgi:hypothetical protein